MKNKPYTLSVDDELTSTIKELILTKHEEI